MKAITVVSTHIHCDTCHHEFEGSPKDWHLLACPKCGAPDIITDRDMKVWTMANALREGINAVVGEVPDDAETVHVSYGTTPR